jgi:tetratricopeptide (TPR) repeat protein
MINNRFLLNYFLILTILAISASSIFAQQLQTPRASPAAVTSQKVGMSEITINYSRPAVQGRAIWGELVPYGFTTFGFGAGNPAPWRAGANENTTITFTHDVEIEGKSLAAGTYGLFMAVQNESDWIIIFSKDNGSWGSFFYDEANDALRITAEPEENEFTEWLEYGFEDNMTGATRVYMKWENVKIGFECEFNTHEIALNSIRTQLKSLPGFGWQGWNQAAFYCLQNETNLEEAEEWCQKSISINENANNRNLLGYVVMALGRMDDALKIFEENIEKYPDNWNIYDSYGEALNNAGRKDKSIEYYKKAHEMAPEAAKQRIEGILAGLEE